VIIVTEKRFVVQASSRKIAKEINKRTMAQRDTKKGLIGAADTFASSINLINQQNCLLSSNLKKKFFSVTDVAKTYIVCPW
jgi:hypothetical protein